MLDENKSWTKKRIQSYPRFNDANVIFRAHPACALVVSLTGTSKPIPRPNVGHGFAPPDFFNPFGPFPPFGSTPFTFTMAQQAQQFKAHKHFRDFLLRAAFPSRAPSGAGSARPPMVGVMF